MTIDVILDPPLLTDPVSDFDTKSFQFTTDLVLWAAQANAMAQAMNLNSTIDTSVTSNTIGAGEKIFTVSLGKSFQRGMWVISADTAAAGTNYIIGVITSYDSESGALVIDSISYAGTGTKTAWTISQAAPGGVTHADIQNQTVTSFTTGGTGTAYTLTPSPAIAAYANGQTFDIQFHATCGAIPTLNINGLGAYSLYRLSGSGSLLLLAAGELLIYKKYSITFCSTADGAFFIVRDANQLRRTKFISATRDMTSVSGNISYSGCGFKPSRVTAYAVVAGTHPSSIGIATSTGTQHIDIGTNDSYNSTGSTYLIYLYSTTAAAGQYATVASLDADGFSLSWNKLSSPAAGTADLRFFCEE